MKKGRFQEKVMIGIAVLILLAAFFLSYFVPHGSFVGKAVGVTHTISIQNFAFTPLVITVQTGDTITWVNNDQALHTVVSSDTGPLDSGDLSNGQSYSYTFTTAGTYDYICSIHPFMLHGQIVVVQGLAVTPPVVIPPPTVSPSLPTNSVVIQNMAFTPSIINVQLNDTVTWINNDPAIHRIVASGLSSLDSGDLSNAQSYSYTFTTVGTYDYSCSIHPSMTGQVIVATPSNVNPPTSPVVVNPPQPIVNVAFLNITLTTPVDTSVLQNETLSFNYSYGGKIPAHCLLYTNSSGAWLSNVTSTLFVNGSYSYMANFANGSYLWNVYCSSGSGTTFVEAWGTNRTFMIAPQSSPTGVDASPNPIIVNLLRPTDHTSLQNETVAFEFSFSGSPQGNCNLYSTFNNGSWESNITFPTVVNGTHNTTLQVPNGRYSWNVNCIDTINSSNSNWADQNFSFSVSVLPANVTINNTNNTSVVSCTESWSCTGWSSCGFGRQTRTCTDLNSCGTIIERPPQTQICVQTSGNVPPSAESRQQEIQTLPSTATQQEETPQVQQPSISQEKSSIWGLIAGIIVVLLTITGLLFYFFYRSKRQSLVHESFSSPAQNTLRQYIAKDRARGVDDNAIRQSLLQAGWNQRDVEEAMRK